MGSRRPRRAFRDQLVLEGRGGLVPRNGAQCVRNVRGRGLAAHVHFVSQVPVLRLAQRAWQPGQAAPVVARVAGDGPQRGHVPRGRPRLSDGAIRDERPLWITAHPSIMSPGPPSPPHVFFPFSLLRSPLGAFRPRCPLGLLPDAQAPHLAGLQRAKPAACPPQHQNFPGSVYLFFFVL
ncbi:hypothetical protein BC826DRAFT_39899 [Russula brevipes]|nr:hypothetical protein BC826DRAFT_39899 [Russula brevipes]